MRKTHSIKISTLFFCIGFLWMLAAFYTYFVSDVICESFEHTLSYNYKDYWGIPLLIKPVNWYWIIAACSSIWAFVIALFVQKIRINNLLTQLVILLILLIVYVVILQLAIMEPSLRCTEITISKGF